MFGLVIVCTAVHMQPTPKPHTQSSSFFEVLGDILLLTISRKKERCDAVTLLFSFHSPLPALDSPLSTYPDECLDRHNAEGDLPRRAVAYARGRAGRHHVRHKDRKAGSVRRGKADPTHRARRGGRRIGAAVPHTAKRQRQGETSAVVYKMGGAGVNSTVLGQSLDNRNIAYARYAMYGMCT